MLKWIALIALWFMVMNLITELMAETTVRGLLLLTP